MAASWSSRRKAGAARQTALDLLRRALDILARFSPVSRFVVADDSMRPAFAPGDRVVVARVAYRIRAPRPGDVVVLRDPEDPARRLLKRVAAVAGGGSLDVRGDNARASRDSRTFGAVQRQSIIGKVWFKY